MTLPSVREKSINESELRTPSSDNLAAVSCCLKISVQKIQLLGLTSAFEPLLPQVFVYNLTNIEDKLGRD